MATDQIRSNRRLPGAAVFILIQVALAFKALHNSCQHYPDYPRDLELEANVPMPYKLIEGNSAAHGQTDGGEANEWLQNTRAHRFSQNFDLPYSCGMVVFYHIPSTGGATINQWLLRYTEGEKLKPKNAEVNVNATYFTHWKRDKKGYGLNESQQTFIDGGDKHNILNQYGGDEKKHGGMNEFVEDFEESEWKIAHIHHSSLELNVSEHLLQGWRDTVESQGCGYVATVMFRDPLSHTLSLHKHLGRFSAAHGHKIDSEEYMSHLKTPNVLGIWATQLDYFLYNFLNRNPYSVDKETKVKRALQLLRDHFDIVTVGNHEGHMKAVLRATGWPKLEMQTMNVHKKDLEFTKKQIESIQKLLKENGDIDLVNGVEILFKDLF